MASYTDIVVMGAGGVGGYFGGRLAQHTEANVTFVARGAHLRAMQQRGLCIQSVDGDAELQVKAVDDTALEGTGDLILFTVKSYDTANAIASIEPIVGDETQVLTIQNGIENYGKLREAFGEDRVIQGFCKIGAGISEPGMVRHKAFGRITVGEKDGSTTPRLEALKALFAPAGIPVHITSQIDRNVWLKFTWNCIFNMLTAAANVTVEKLFHHPETVALCYRMYDEIRAVAAAEGVELTKEDGEEIIEPARELDGFTTSTYQDRQKGKRLEYEAFTGAIIRLADAHGVKVPSHRVVYALLKAVDTHADG